MNALDFRSRTEGLFVLPVLEKKKSHISYIIFNTQAAKIKHVHKALIKHRLNIH